MKIFEFANSFIVLDEIIYTTFAENSIGLHVIEITTRDNNKLRNQYTSYDLGRSVYDRLIRAIKGY